MVAAGTSAVPAVINTLTSEPIGRQIDPMSAGRDSYIITVSGKEYAHSGLSFQSFTLSEILYVGRSQLHFCVASSAPEHSTCMRIYAASYPANCLSIDHRKD
jgi:hypothetical protein